MDALPLNSGLSMPSVGEGKTSRSRSSKRRSNKPSSREARQRRRHKSEETCSSNLEETQEQWLEPFSRNHESESSDSEDQSSDLYLPPQKIKKSHGKYPLQFKLLYSTNKKHDKPRAMARVLNDWEFFRVTDWRKDRLFHKTDGLPEELVKLTHWKPKAWDQLKSLLIEMMEEIEIDLKGQWSLQTGITDVDEKGIEHLVQKYDELPAEAVYYCNLFRRSLTEIPSCGNTIGRSALVYLCTMLWILMPMPYKHRCQPINVGGGALTWDGNCKIGYVFCKQEDLTDEQLGDLFRKGSVPVQQMRVCDFQIIDPVTWKRYWISGEIKTVEDMIGSVKEWDARRQTWEQCLPGLQYDDETYAILFTPKEAELFQLRLSPSKRKLFTYTKTYSLRTEEEEETLNKFATDQLEKLMVDLMGIMFRGSVNIRDSAGGSSSKQ